MSKRAAEALGNEASPLKAGDRPFKHEDGDEKGDFEDDFEDDFDSEDEIVEAGVDGRPDEEREAEEKRGMCFMPDTLCDATISHVPT